MRHRCWCFAHDSYSKGAGFVRENPLAGTDWIPNIRLMTDFRDIRPLTPEERAQRATQRQMHEEQERQRILDQLDNWEWGREEGGRTPIILPPEIAQRVVADIDAGHSDRAIVKKYSTTPWAFSCRWLSDAKKDGRLHRMAASRDLMRENARGKRPRARRHMNI